MNGKRLTNDRIFGIRRHRQYFKNCMYIPQIAEGKERHDHVKI